MSDRRQQSEMKARMAEAERWLIQLQSPALTDAQEAEFFRWLESSPMNQVAYIKAEENWQRGEVLARARSPRERQPEKAPWWEPLMGWQSGLVAAVLCVAVGVGLYVPGSTTHTASYKTALGEQRQVTLPDGSVLTLNTGSRVSVAMTSGSRQVTLEEGEVFFDVAPDAGRPFDVKARSGMVRVLGTEFSVYDSQDGILVTVLEGAVGVDRQSDAAGAFSADIKLAPNQEVYIEEADVLDAPREVDAVSKLSWRKKNLVFRGDTLQYVVDEINRYYDKQLLIEDSELSKKRVSAVIQITSFERTLAVLRQSLHLDTEVNDSGDVVLTETVAEK